MATKNHDGTWTMTDSEYQELNNDWNFLRALEAAGVDNWSGYEEAWGRYDAGDF